MKTNQLKQIVENITRPDSNTCIDLILTNYDIVKESGIVDINISDHVPIYFVRKKAKIKRTKTAFNGRSYNNLDQEQFFEFPSRI